MSLPISSDHHPASFRGYLREKLTEKVSLKEFNELDGTAPDAEVFSRDYAAKLRAYFRWWRPHVGCVRRFCAQMDNVNSFCELRKAELIGRL